MPTIKYSDNPNEETAFAIQDGGQKNRVVLTAAVDGEIEFPANPNSTKVSVTVDGVKRKAVAVATIAGGGGGGSVDKNEIINKAASLPEASASTLGQVYMYDGEDTEAYTHGYIYQNQPTYSEESATISQTAGGNTVSFETIDGNTEMSGTIDAVQELLSAYGWAVSAGDLTFQYVEFMNAWLFFIEDVGSASATTEWLEGIGFSFVGTPQNADRIVCTFSTGLSDLSVDLDTFVEAEQPSGSETVSFVCDDLQDIPEVLYGENGGFSCEIVDPSLFISQVDDYWSTLSTGSDAASYGIGISPQGGENEISVWVFDGEGNSGGTSVAMADAGTWGLSVDGPQEIVPDTIMLIEPMKQLHNVTVVWSKNGVTVDIAEYGVSYSGTPAIGDTLAVSYTAPSIVDYTWNQLNVQPSGETIKWAGQWDKPAELTNEWWFPNYDFPMLPSGSYEMYVQSKRIKNNYSNEEAEWCYSTFKIVFSVFRDDNTVWVSGHTCWVLDGSSGFADGYNLSSSVRFAYSTNNQDTDRLTSEEYVTNGRVYNEFQSQVVDALFRWTNVKNVETGEEYPVTVTDVYNYAQHLPTYLQTIQGGDAINPPMQPAYRTGVQQWTISDSAQRIDISNYFVASPRDVGTCKELDLVLELGSDRYHATIYNGVDSHVLRVYEATGTLANVQIGSTREGGNISILLNTPQGTMGTIRVQATALGSMEPQIYLNGMYESWALAEVYTPTKIGGTVVPENFGMILQYDGETDANYTNGYFYKATGTKVVTPKSMAFSDYNVSATVSVTDLDALIAEISNYTGWSTSDVESYMDNPHTWTISYSTIDGVTFVSFGFWDTTEASVLQYVSVVYDQDGDITCLATYTPESTTITNGHWERVDVQPAGLTNKATGNNSTGIGEDTSSYSVLVTAPNAVAIGPAAQVTGNGDNGVAVGNDARVTSYSGIAIGTGAQVSAANSIMLRAGTAGSWAINSDAGTFKVNLGSGTHLLMDANGNVPAARMATVPSAAGTYTLQATVDAQGNVTLAWV